MKLSDDSTQLHIHINGPLDARQVETLISDLAQHRAGMQPPVAAERPNPAEAAERISVQDDPSVMAVPLNDGRIRFWIRNDGLGWLVFNFSTTQAIALRDFFAAHAADPQHAPRLFGDQGGSGPTAH